MSYSIADKLPLQAASDTTLGTVLWTTIMNITAGAASYGLVSLAGGATSNYIIARNFAFSVPTNGVIDGAFFIVLASAGVTGVIRDASVFLVGSTGVIGTSDGAIRSVWATSNSNYLFGGSSITWGLTLTPGVVNANSFGLALLAVNIGGGVGTTAGGIATVEGIIHYSQTNPLLGRTVTRNIALGVGRL